MIYSVITDNYYKIHRIILLISLYDMDLIKGRIVSNHPKIRFFLFIFKNTKVINRYNYELLGFEI